MKKIILITVFLLMTACQTADQQEEATGWQYLGARGFTVGDSPETFRKLDITTVGYTPYVTGVAGSQAGLDGRVWKWNIVKERWDSLGVLSRSTDKIKLIKDENETVYVTYNARDENSPYKKLHIKKMGRRDWVSVADPITFPVLDFSFLVHNDIIYVIYTSWEPRQLKVNKWDGTQWIDLNSSSLDQTHGGDLLLYNNELHISHWLDDKTHIKKWNGSTWEVVGTPITYPSNGYYVKLLSEVNGKLYISFVDKDAQYMEIKDYNHGSWQTVTKQRIEFINDSDRVMHAQIKVQNEKIYFVLNKQRFDYNSNGNGSIYNNIYLTAYDVEKKQWEEIGYNGIVHNKKSGETAVAISKNGTPYVFFSDDGQDPVSFNGAGTVKHYVK